MEIRKSKNGISYRAKVYLPDGKSVTKTFSRKTDAVDWKNKFKSEIKRNVALGIDFLKQEITFGEVFSLWFSRKINGIKSPKTVSDYRTIGNKHLLPNFEKRGIRKVTKEDSDRLISELKQRQLSNKTINKIMSVFKQVVSFAESDGYLSRNALRGLPMLKEELGRLEYLSQQEILQLLRCNSTEVIYPILLLAVNTGMRVGELTGLCWDRINFETETIEVSRTLGQHGLRETTKSNRARYIPMNFEVKEELWKLFRQQKDPRFVFVDGKGFPYNSDHFSQRHFSKALERAGVRKITFHILRHTYASQFMMKGGSIYDLQKVLGHSSINMTMIYAHLSPQHLRKTMDVVRFSCDGDKGHSPNSAPRNLGNEKPELKLV